MQPRPLPPNYVDRQDLLDEVATKLLKPLINPNKYEATLTLTGAGGFGKTIIAMSLCHRPDVKKEFTDGFAFIELGPQAVDPSVKLSQLYHLLTGEDLKHGDDDIYTEQEIKQIANIHYRKLLVIIDDVWDAEDALPLVKAFSNCRIILTTRMNDIEQYIPSQNSVSIGAMTLNEAISLLTEGIIDKHQISQNFSLLRELAEDVHLWPLLLSLTRGHLLHHLKQQDNKSCIDAIQCAKAQLHDRGLTAFDKNNIKRCRNLAVKACIEVTLELLKQPVSEKFKILILWTGIGTSLQKVVLKDLWNISEQEAADSVDKLWAYGLIRFSATTVSLSITQTFVEVHAVISQYIVDNIDSKEVGTLSPFVGSRHVSVHKALLQTLTQRVRNAAFSSKKDFLECTLYELQNFALPHNLKMINMHIITNPHMIKLTLQRIKECIMNSYYIMHLLSLVEKDIELLIEDCKEVLRNAYKICRILNQDTQKCLHNKNYDELIPKIEKVFENYCLGNIAQEAVTMAKQIIPHCDGEEQYYMTLWYEDMYTMTTEYHAIKTYTLPIINFLVKQIKQITTSLQNGARNIDLTYQYFKLMEEKESLTIQYLINLQKVSPNIVQMQAPEYGVDGQLLLAIQNSLHNA